MMEPTRLDPFDQHNARLLAAVHPSGWPNPAPRPRYHLAVLGAGTGGLVSAAGAAGLGGRVALIEKHLMGGDCLNVGCVPSKALISAARSWDAARRAGREFAGPAVTGEGDFGAVMERLRRLRADLSPVDGAARFAGLGVDVFFGTGRFTGPDTLEVGGATVRFRRAIVATGARAAAPPIPGLEGSGYLTNETVFSLTKLPKRLVVIGAGPIGCEMAQSFAQFGAKVTLVDRAPRILARDDQDAAALVAARLAADGVDLELGVEIAEVTLGEGARAVTLVRDGAPFTIHADEILVAAGRAPNVEGLGLEAAGIGFDRTGVTVDDRLRTTNPRVFAVGDVCSALQFTHHADFQARLVLANALFFGRGRASRLIVPWCTYTSPEVAQVGLTAAAAAARGVAADEIVVPFHDVDRAVLEDDTEGLLKVVVARGSDRILGVTIAAPHAGEMIGEAVVAMTNGLGLGAVGRAMHPYPTVAEAYRKAADQWRRKKLTPFVRRALAVWFRVFR